MVLVLVGWVGGLGWVFELGSWVLGPWVWFLVLGGFGFLVCFDFGLFWGGILCLLFRVNLVILTARWGWYNIR